MLKPRDYLLKALLSGADYLTVALAASHPAPRMRRIISNVSYGGHRHQRLDVIIPPADPPLPALIFVHGGGWVAGHKSVYTAACRWLAQEGFCVFNINYRLGPTYRWPAPLQDIARALGWVHRHAADYGADASALVLAGDSAGAHLVSFYAAALHKTNLFMRSGISGPFFERDVRGLMLFYGAYDLFSLAGVSYPFVWTMLHTLLGPGQGFARRAAVASPLSHVDGSLPPCFITAAESDGLYPQSVRLAARLTEHGVPHRTVFFNKAEYPGANHGFLYLHWRPPARLAVRQGAAFIRACIS